MLTSNAYAIQLKLANSCVGLKLTAAQASKLQDMTLDLTNSPVLRAGEMAFGLVGEPVEKVVQVLKASSSTLYDYGQMHSKVSVKPTLDRAKFKDIGVKESQIREQKRAVLLDSKSGKLSKHKPQVQPVKEVKKRPPVQLTENHLRSSILHWLAVSPHSAADLALKLRKSEAQVLVELKQIATPQYSDTSRYQLKTESYRDLYPFLFDPFSIVERELAIKNANIAFDSLGLAKDCVERKRLIEPVKILIDRPASGPTSRSEKVEFPESRPQSAPIPSKSPAFKSTRLNSPLIPKESLLSKTTLSSKESLPKTTVPSKESLPKATVPSKESLLPKTTVPSKESLPSKDKSPAQIPSKSPSKITLKLSQMPLKRKSDVDPLPVSKKQDTVKSKGNPEKSKKESNASFASHSVPSPSHPSNHSVPSPSNPSNHSVPSPLNPIPMDVDKASQQTTDTEKVYTKHQLIKMTRPELILHIKTVSSLQNDLYTKLQHFIGVGNSVSSSIAELDDVQSLALIQSRISKEFDISNETEFLASFERVMSKYTLTREYFGLCKSILESLK